jgi:hypothetical protein
MTASLTKLDVEDLLVWTYRQQRADVVCDRGLGLHDIEASLDHVELHGISLCGCAEVERIQQLGVRVDGTGGCSALHEDAELVHQVVSRLAVPLQHLVIRHARERERPDVMAGLRPRPIPAINGKGTPSVRYEPWDRYRNYGWCPIRWTVSLVMIEAARFEYTLWLDALARIAATLRIEGRLTRHVVTGPAALLRPWERSA